MNEIVPTHNIGGYVPMVDGPEKVSGRAKYTADLLAARHAGRAHLSQPLFARARSSRSTSREALKLPGVKAIVTGADCDKTFGVLPIARSEHPLARDKVRYRGEPVAAVAAVDDATARKALALIRLKVRELPAYYTAKAALAPDAVDIHEHRPGQSRARRVLRARQRRGRASPRPTWCARAPTTAPRSARTRWRCTPRSPTTTPSATA